MKRKGKLEQLFEEVSSVILCRQHPVTGLLPASTSVNTHGDYTDAWVRDNVYSIMCVWCLSMAFRRFGDATRQDELEQATIKLMRGLLMSMMRQANKVEKFKHTLNQIDALHAKYDTASGLEVVADDAWGHLQIDATSIFLLMIAQMTGSGFRIINTLDEVDFVQNLVYYVASAYRTPDFGIWERGNKINNGKTEINASSVGMAKAALQALDGFNLFGKDATDRAIVHSVPDAISLARNTLGALLPRESLSKETDSALLSIIGFPAFAIGNKVLATKTRDDILAKLGGDYGCKRFLLDGHQTVLEESTRLYYEHSELANFAHIESEWPLFFTYLYIQALFDGNDSTAQHYREKLESLMVEVGGKKLLPELYYVEEQNIEKEKLEPRSQPRVPNENVPLVWAQSLYLTGLMLDEGFVTRDDLDPLKLRSRSSNAPETQIALVVLAENEAVKKHLAEHGVIAEALTDIAPVNVITASSLVEVYTYVGSNSRLHLSGRPRRRLQSLATSQAYIVNGLQCLCLSWMQSEHDDYRGYDPQLMATHIEREIAHIRSHWVNREVAVFTWMIDEHFCHVKDVEVLYKVLKNLQLREASEHVGYASATLAMRASRINKLVVPEFCLMPIVNRAQSEQDIPATAKIREADERLDQLFECFEIESELTFFKTLEAFETEFGMHASFGEAEHKITAQSLIRTIYRCAQMKGNWLVTRFCFALLGQFPIDLADVLTSLTARHLSVVIGKGKSDTVAIDAPMRNREIAECINNLYQHPLERTMVQEMLAIIGIIMRTEPTLFEGLRSLQIDNLIVVCAQAKDNATEREICLAAGALSPSELLHRAHEFLELQHTAFREGLAGEVAEGVGAYGSRAISAVAMDWFEWRAARGAITRLDDKFLGEIWCSLENAKELVFGDRGSQDYVLDCELARSSMTAGEASFALLVDSLLQQLHPTYFKCAVVETLQSYTEFCVKNPTSRFLEPIVFPEILERAAKSFIWDTGNTDPGKRDLDSLLEQPSSILKRYTTKVFEELAQPAEGEDVAAE